MKLKREKTKNSIINIRLKLLYVLNLISMIWLYPVSKKSLAILQIHGITAVRAGIFSGTLGINSLLDWVIVAWIIAPIFNVTLVLGIYKYIFNNEKKLLIISIVNVIVYTITFGGRWMILRSILLFLFTSLIYMNDLKSRINNKKIKKYSKRIKKNYIVMLLLAFVILFITKYRSFDGNILKTIVAYFTGSLSSLSYWMEVTKEKTYLLGTGFFSGILDFPLMMFKIISEIDLIRPTEYIGQFTSPNVYIGGGIIFNGFCSCLLDFWLDFGILGALINGSLLGIITMKIYNKSISSFRWKMLYLFILTILAVTPIKWEFDLQWSWMTIIFLFLFVKE